MYTPNYFNIGNYQVKLNSTEKKKILGKILCSDDYNYEVDEGEYGFDQYFVFKSTAKICRERLECFGITKEKIIKEFKQKISDSIGNEHLEADLNHSIVNQDYIDYYEHLDFEKYLKIISEIISGNILEQNDTYNFIKNRLIYCNCALLVSSPYDFWDSLIYYPYESENWIYTLLLAVPDDTIISVGGFQNLDPEELISNEKIVLLTEGITDTEFIKKIFQIFYPHLYPFYHFINYEDINLQGSASALVNTIRAFVGINIKNNVIAIFDNDTAGSLEIKNLKKIKKMPSNIKILQYPYLDYLCNYPTVLPPTNEIRNMNVNELAGSIEMYLGIKILTDNSSSNLHPVYWSNYEQNMGKYQGGLSPKDKKIVQDKFREKIRKLEKKEEELNPSDWMDFIKIIDTIRNAWSDL